MKTPTWGTVIGVMMIIFGGCGAMNDIQSIGMPSKMAEERVKIKARIAEKEAAKKDTTATVTVNESDTTTTTASADSVDDSDTEDIPFFGKKSPEEIISLSEYSATWIVRFGYIGAVVSLIYLAAGIFLLVRRTFSIKLVYAALALSLLCAGVQTAVLTSTAAESFMSKMIGLSQLPGILIDIILLAVVFASEKDAYKEENLSR